MRLSSGIIAGMPLHVSDLRVGKPHKYGAKATVVDGIRFASLREANRYSELKLLERAGEIRNIELQPRFTFYVHFETMFTYVADFAYERPITVAELEEVKNDKRRWRSGCFLPKWHRVIEDVKGVRTPIYKLKKKLIEKSYGITIVET